MIGLERLPPVLLPLVQGSDMFVRWRVLVAPRDSFLELAQRLVRITQFKRHAAKINHMPRLLGLQLRRPLVGLLCLEVLAQVAVHIAEI